MPILKSHFHFYRDASLDLSFDPPMCNGWDEDSTETIGTQFRKQKYFLITLGFALQWIGSTYHGRKRNSIELRQKLVKKFELNSGDGNLPASSDFLTFLLLPSHFTMNKICQASFWIFTKEHHFLIFQYFQVFNIQPSSLASHRPQQFVEEFWLPWCPVARHITALLKQQPIPTVQYFLWCVVPSPPFLVT